MVHSEVQVRKLDQETIKKIQKLIRHSKEIDEYTDYVSNIFQTCAEKANVSMVEAYQFLVPRDKKCFYMCLAMMHKLMDSSGKFDVDRAIKEVPPVIDVDPDDVASMRKCVKQEKVGDPCETAKMALICFARDRERM